MRRVIFPIVRNDIFYVYPDNDSLFSNVEIEYDEINMTADYTGTDDTIADAPPPLVYYVTVTGTSAVMADGSNAILNQESVNPLELIIERNGIVNITFTLDDTTVNESWKIPYVNSNIIRYFYAVFTDGVGTVSTTLDTSGIWYITSDLINEHTPDNYPEFTLDRTIKMVVVN